MDCSIHEPRNLAQVPLSQSLQAFYICVYVMKITEKHKPFAFCVVRVTPWTATWAKWEKEPIINKAWKRADRQKYYAKYVRAESFAGIKLIMVLCNRTLNCRHAAVRRPFVLSQWHICAILCKADDTCAHFFVMKRTSNTLTTFHESDV